MEDLIAGIFTLLMFAFFIGTYIVTAISVSKIAKLSGHGNIAWYAWLPIVHEVLLLKLVKKPEWYIVLIYFVPIVNWVLRWWLQYEFLKYCRKPGWWVAIMILFFPAYPFLIWRMGQDFEYNVVESQDFQTAGDTGQDGYF